MQCFLGYYLLLDGLTYRSSFSVNAVTGRLQLLAGCNGVVDVIERTGTCDDAPHLSMEEMFAD